MSILSFCRRTKSRFSDDKAVDSFERVVEQTRILSDERTHELASLIVRDDPTPAEVARIGKLLGAP
ncbi:MULTISPECIES: hypothetical protein [unclassified Afipia]|uniref:hypothetical protein n=1 Tax=unclassified Afipia TaxID=2642050 RepID=UPI000407E737|nr:MULTISPECIES: hypothetical protein [unclassified Afipia]